MTDGFPQRLRKLREMDGEPLWITDIVDGVVFREQLALIFSAEQDAVCFSTKESGDDSRLLVYIARAGLSTAISRRRTDMDYKELIEKLRSRDGCRCECLQAATAIETLLAEQAAAVEDLRKVAKCDSCKWCHSDISACKGCGMFYKKWEWRGPQKESGNNGQA